MVSKDEYLKQAELKYNKMVEADTLARELESRLSEIRGMGFKVIVLGNTVKITI